MSAHAHDHGHAAEGHHGHVAHSPSHYIRIWALLLVLLTVSIIGPMAEIPVVTLITAFGIAFVKAGLVIKYFMHLDIELPFVRYILVTSILFMLMFFFAVSVDVLNHDGARWTNVAARQAIAAELAKGDPTLHGGGDHGADHGADASHAAPAEGAAPAGGGH